LRKCKKFLAKVFSYDNDMGVPLIAVLEERSILFSEVFMKKLLVAVLFSSSAFATGAKLDFATADTNKDKTVDASDAPADNAEKAKEVNDFIAAHDADKDGKVTEAEAKAAGAHGAHKKAKK
jgi:hypothetical protein